MVGPEKLLGRMFNKCLGEKYGYLPGEEMKFDDSKTTLVTPGNFEETEAEAEAEAEADPAYFYNGYGGYAGWGYAGYGLPHAYAGYHHAGYPYGAYHGYAPSDPTAPHLLHTSRVGICTNYLGARVPC